MNLVYYIQHLKYSSQKEKDNEEFFYKLTNIVKDTLHLLTGMTKNKETIKLIEHTLNYKLTKIQQENYMSAYINIEVTGYVITIDCNYNFNYFSIVIDFALKTITIRRFKNLERK